MTNISQQLIEAAKELSEVVGKMVFSEPVKYVYNPLDYAWESYRLYLTRYGVSKSRFILMGMNPGPWGMAQTGVPFGEIEAVKNFLKIETAVKEPSNEHPKRPVQGFDCSRSEVSGRRLWGLFEERFKRAEAFFEDYFIANYCPLVFMEESGRNRTPDKLKKEERQLLFQHCDRHLQKTIEALEPEWIIGVGKFAYNCANRVLESTGLSADIRTASILHPSPASPAANKDWPGTVTRQFVELGIW